MCGVEFRAVFKRSVQATFSKETTKYMENQMNVVSTNMKKFYNELIQDLLPSPMILDDAIRKPDPMLHYGILFPSTLQQNTSVYELKASMDTDTNRESSQLMQENGSIISQVCEWTSETLIEQRENIGQEQIYDSCERLQIEIAEEALGEERRSIGGEDSKLSDDCGGRLQTCYAEGALIDQKEYFGQEALKKSHESGDILRTDFTEGELGEQGECFEQDVEQGHDSHDRLQTDFEVALTEKSEVLGESHDSGGRLLTDFEGGLIAQGEGFEKQFKHSHFSDDRLQNEFAEGTEGTWIEQREDNEQDSFKQTHDSGDSEQTDFTEEARIERGVGVQQEDFQQSYDSDKSLETNLSEGIMIEWRDGIRHEYQSHDLGKKLQASFALGSCLQSDVVGEKMYRLRLPINTTTAMFSSVSNVGIVPPPLDRVPQQTVFGENFECIIFRASNNSSGYCSDTNDEHSGTYEAEKNQQQSARWYVNERESGSQLFSCSDNYFQIESCQEEIETGWEFI